MGSTLACRSSIDRPVFSNDHLYFNWNFFTIEICGFEMLVKILTAPGLHFLITFVKIFDGEEDRILSLSSGGTFRWQYVQRVVIKFHV